ncbi:MAG: DUF4232 domain-containing protein [Acidimicrobiales bacterium]
MRRAWRAAAALVCVGLIAAACSSKPGSPTSTGTTGGSHRTTTTTQGTSATSTTASPTTTTGIAACAQVTATPGQSQGAAGTIVGTITLAPVGTATCTMEGYPALARFSSSGATVPITVVNGLTVNLSGPPTQPPSVVTLSSGQQAEFTFEYSDVPTGSETQCASSATVTVTPPGATTASAQVPLTMAPCNNGTVEVSPVYAAIAS